MSRDSSHTYIHLHSSRHADLFEEFCRPPSSTTSNTHFNGTTTNHNNPHGTANTMVTSDPSLIQLPGHFLPFEEIHLPQHLMPVNPEDEDDVVPDMHAAFGINRALGQGASGGEGSGAGERREAGWRDLGLERLLDGNGNGNGTVSGNGAGGAVEGSAARREGVRRGLLLMR